MVQFIHSLHKKDVSVRKEAELQLTIANERLQKLNAEKDKFFSIIAHDLRSPFSGFLGLTKVMAEDLLSMPITEIMELSKIMQESADSMYKLLKPPRMVTYAARDDAVFTGYGQGAEPCRTKYPASGDEL